jgi:hypothetical protein
MSSSEVVEFEVDVASSLLGDVRGGSTTVSAGSTVWPSMTRLTRFRLCLGVSLCRSDDLVGRFDLFAALACGFFLASSPDAACSMSLVFFPDFRPCLFFSASLDGHVPPVVVRVSALAALSDLGLLSCFFSGDASRASSSGRNRGVTRPWSSFSRLCTRVCFFCLTFSSGSGSLGSGSVAIWPSALQVEMFCAGPGRRSHSMERYRATS